MNFLSGVALVLLTLVGYSSGSVLAGKNRKVTPGILDVLVTLALFVALFLIREPLGLGKWLSVLVGFGFGFVTGALLTLARKGRYPAAEAKPAAPETANPFKRFWHSYKAFSSDMGMYQGFLLLTWFYFVIVTPFGLLYMLFGKPRRARQDAGTFWVDYPARPDTDIESARRQY